jgi:tetratricopeptide (TPR) repeat protein
MKADHRHELQTNELAAWLENTSDRIKPYARAIVGVCVAIAIIIAVYAYVSALERRGSAAASEQLIAAIQYGSPTEFQTLIDQHRGTQPAALARLLLAERLLDQGADSLFTDKSSARENLLKASDAFQSAEQEVQDPMLRAWALYGVGRAHEAMGDLDRARSDYEKVIKQFSDSSLADPARSHLARLNQMSTKEFYDWFAKQDPRPPVPEKEPGTPGQKPLFDLTDPAAPGDLKLPSATSGPAPGAGVLPPADTVPSVGSAPPAGDASSGAKPAVETPAEAAPKSQAAPPATDKSEAAPPDTAHSAATPTDTSK